MSDTATLHAGMQTEACHLADRVDELIFRVTGQQRLQGKHLAPRLRTHGDAVRDRVTP